MISLRNVTKYCKDYTKIENYDKAIADNAQTWACHHKMELVETGAVVDSTTQDLIDWGIYYDRPADELIFLTPSEHTALHNRGRQYTKGNKHSEETKAKMSAALKGKKMSEEQKAKISAAMKGNQNAKGNFKGKHWKLVDGKRVLY